MAFNFNWSPLVADTSRARDMLTAALNKSPKPPIIVDDIIVTELNLGSVPPELEILEVGDLAEDRFRGIFKLSYTGDAFLTLKTKVQANPLNTYLSDKPKFVSPQPLAASSSLTIPLQITLSEIKLSGFVILVFSRQKGITLVFRNDPLESLKVSSTFDSIPFVRDYLQRTIEEQLRNLFMEDLPAIIHRLSLRLWSPEYQEVEEKKEDDTVPIDPLASPPQDPVDAFGNPISEAEIAALSLDTSSETHASFSQKNLLRLAALTESNRTLSLFTPSIREAVFRAWAGTSERAEYPGTNTPILNLSNLSRVHSSAGGPSSSTCSTSDPSENGSFSSRPAFSSTGSNYTGIGGIGVSRTSGRSKRTPKRRVVNLRRDKENDTDSIKTESSTPAPSITASDASSPQPEAREGEITTPPQSPKRPIHRDKTDDSVEDFAQALQPLAEAQTTPIQRREITKHHKPDSKTLLKSPIPQHLALKPSDRSQSYHTSSNPLLRNCSAEKIPFAGSPSSKAGAAATPLQLTDAPSSGGILEQAWMKMAAEIARKAEAEKTRVTEPRFWERREGHGNAQGKGSDDFWDGPERAPTPPPAYAA